MNKQKLEGSALIAYQHLRRAEQQRRAQAMALQRAQVEDTEQLMSALCAERGADPATAEVSEDEDGVWLTWSTPEAELPKQKPKPKRKKAGAK